QSPRFRPPRHIHSFPTRRSSDLDGRRYEIHDGELSVTPSPSLEHQIILANLLRILFQHVPSAAPGLVLAAPLDVILADTPAETRSEEHTSELQSPDHLVCRLLLA